jgi:hypothetical protein
MRTWQPGNCRQKLKLRVLFLPVNGEIVFGGFLFPVAQR